MRKQPGVILPPAGFRTALLGSRGSEDSALLIHRLHFAFTVTFHYLFPQLTMGLAPLIVVLKTLALRKIAELAVHDICTLQCCILSTVGA